MICKKCGAEFSEGIFCPQCGTKNMEVNKDEETVENEVPKEENADKNVTMGESSRDNKKKKVPWYLNGFFILAILLPTYFISFIFCIPAIILCVIRLVKCKEKRRVTIIWTIIVIIISFMVMLFRLGDDTNTNTDTSEVIEETNNEIVENEENTSKGESKVVETSKPEATENEVAKVVKTPKPETTENEEVNENTSEPVETESQAKADVENDLNESEKGVLLKDTPETFPYQNSKASTFVKLYKKALENEKDVIYLTADDVVTGLYGDIEKVESYKVSTTQTSYQYYGNIKSGKPSGKGVLFENGCVRYIGEFSKGYPDGFGISFIEELGTYLSSIRYEGEWKKGYYNGKGVLYYPVSNDLLGYFDKGMAQYYADKDVYSQYLEKQGDRILYDVLIGCMNIEYEGEYKNGNREGKGVAYGWSLFENPITYDQVYDGEWKDGEYNGKGTLYNTDGITYEGEWKDGKYNGKGTLYNADGTVYLKGKFKDGTFVK